MDSTDQNTGEKNEGEGRKNVVLTPSSPYYLHPSDHPGMNICPVILKGDNYQEWAKSMRNALRAKRKLGFLDGTVKKSNEDASEIEDWYSVNSMLMGWIFQSIEPTLGSTITIYDTVTELLQDLHQRFSVGNGPRVHQLRADLARYQQERQSIAVYYGRLKKFWDELSNYITTGRCTCGRCSCKWADELNKEREDERVHQFLMGLDDDVYGTLRSHILAQDPLPPLNRVYALSVQEERHHIIARARDTHKEAMSFVVQAVPSSLGISSSQNDKLVCKHCRRQGHDLGSCLKLIGYPEWWGGARGSRKGAGRGKGDGIGSRGRGTVGVANAAHVGDSTSISQFGASATLTNQDRATFSPALSDEQWASVVSMLKTFNAKPGSSEKLAGKSMLSQGWILDTGASHHMNGDKNLLEDLKDIPPSPISLPNWTQTNALKEGTMILGDRLKIQNVLYVPHLRCNLISLATLIIDLNCIVRLTKKLCVIQDHTSRTVIGVGEQSEGVCLLASLGGSHKAGMSYYRDQLLSIMASAAWTSIETDGFFYI